MKRNELYTLLAVLVVFAILGSYMWISSENPENEGTKVLAGKLTFPRDEGVHTDTQEAWNLYMNLSSDSGKDYWISGMWVMQRINSQTTRGFKIYMGEGGTLMVRGFYSDFSKTEESNKTLNIRWMEKDGKYTFLNKTSGKGIKNASYSFSYSDADSFLSIKLNMKSESMPVLFGLDGNADMGYLGALKGYIAAEMKINGYIFYNGEKIHVDGRGVLTHLWGFIGEDPSFVSSMLKNEDHTIFFFRTYLQNKNPSWEFFYVIGHGRYTVFITHFDEKNGDKTIGASISYGYNIKDLKNERYDAYIIDYFPDPTKRDNHICYPDHWFLKSYYDDYGCVFAPSDFSSNMRTSWEGFIKGVDSSNRSMWGFESIYTYYNSNIKFLNISADKSDGKLEVKAELKSSLPLNAVYLNYSFNLSGSWEKSYKKMSYDGKEWRLSLDIPAEATGVKLMVHAQDKSYQWYHSEEKLISL